MHTPNICTSIAIDQYTIMQLRGYRSYKNRKTKVSVKPPDEPITDLQSITPGCYKEQKRQLYTPFCSCAKDPHAYYYKTIQFGHA